MFDCRDSATLRFALDFRYRTSASKCRNATPTRLLASCRSLTSLIYLLEQVLSTAFALLRKLLHAERAKVINRAFHGQYEMWHDDQRQVCTGYTNALIENQKYTILYRLINNEDSVKWRYIQDNVWQSAKALNDFQYQAKQGSSWSLAHCYNWFALLHNLGEKVVHRILQYMVETKFNVFYC